MSFKVLGGTPQHGGKGLCHSCKFSQVMRAAAESDVMVFCKADGWFNHALQIHKPVLECSEYANKLAKSEYELNKIAWILATKNGKPIGFLSAREAKEKSKHGDIDKIDRDDE